MSDPNAAGGAIARDPDAPAEAAGVAARLLRYFVIRLGTSLYALPAELVDHVAPACRPVRVPGAAAHVLGVTQLRERIMTVVDAHTVLGLGQAAASNGARRLVVLKFERAPFALLADAVLGVHETTADSIHEVADARAEAQRSGTPSIGSFELPDGVVTVLAADLLLSAVLRR